MEENVRAQVNKNQAVRILIITLLAILVLVFFISKDMEKVRVFIRGSGWIGLLVSVGIYGLLGASPVPSEPLTILISTIFGPLNATLVAGAGNLLAAVIEYFIGGKLGDASSFARRKEKLPFGLGRFPVSSPIFLIIARMIPGYGPKFVSLLAGLYRVPLGLYLWTAALPTFLGAAIFAYGGFGLLLLRMKSW